MEALSKSGFGGAIRVMVGFSTDGTILNVNVLEQKETPGLGTKMCDEGNVLLMSIKDKNPAQMQFSVKKDGGELDALTAATISSRAYYDAVKCAHDAFLLASGANVELDSETGATATAENENEEGATAQEGGQNE